MPKHLPTKDNPDGARLLSEHIVGSGDSEPIPIDLSLERVACPRHGEPFRTKWPDGFMVFSLNLFEAFIKEKDDDISVQETIDARPLCELVNAFDLLHAYQASEIGIMASCAICGYERPGTPYQTMVKRQTRLYPHMCFECVVFRLQPLS